MSEEPIIKGINQFPNPPIKIGITAKKIMIKAWAVTIELNSWSLFKNEEGVLNSNRIKNLNIIPTKLLHTPKSKYRVPIILWLEEYIHFINILLLNKNLKFNNRLDFL